MGFGHVVSLVRVPALIKQVRCLRVRVDIRTMVAAVKRVFVERPDTRRPGGDECDGLGALGERGDVEQAFAASAVRVLNERWGLVPGGWGRGGRLGRRLRRHRRRCGRQRGRLGRPTRCRRPGLEDLKKRRHGVALPQPSARDKDLTGARVSGGEYAVYFLEHIRSSVPGVVAQLENVAMCPGIVFAAHDVEGPVDVRRGARPAAAVRHVRASRPLVSRRIVDLHDIAARPWGVPPAVPATEDVDLCMHGGGWGGTGRGHQDCDAKVTVRSDTGIHGH